MQELFTTEQFSVWFTILCVIWTALFLVVGFRHRRFAPVAGAGAAAYLLWLLYQSLTKWLDIERVGGVLTLVALFLLLGGLFGRLCARRVDRGEPPAVNESPHAPS